MPDSIQGSIQDYWRKCTTCKKLIGFNKKYWICSVSTCNRVRTDLVFCDLKCFDAHVPVMNHRDAGAFEKVSPGERAAIAQPDKDKPKPSSVSDPNEILVVASKVKSYIRSKAMMNTSDAVMDILSEKVRKFANYAIENANRSGRKTVMDRDV